MKQSAMPTQSKRSLRHSEMSLKITPFGPTQAAPCVARNALRHVLARRLFALSTGIDRRD
jgi:hypothetical protein